MPLDVKKPLDLKNLDLKNLPKPALAAIAVLVIGGAGFGVFHAMSGSAPDAGPPSVPPPQMGRGGPSMSPGGPPGSPGSPPGLPPPGSPPAPGTSAPTPAVDPVSALRVHLLQHPDIARVDFQAANVASLDVTLRAGVSDAQAVDVARRIRRYMAATYPNADDMTVVAIIIHRHIGDNSHLLVQQDIDEKAGTVAWHTVLNTVNGPRILD